MPRSAGSSTRTQKGKNPGIPIAGIGASAGGLEAFEQFFRHAPADSGLAFVLITHLDPSHGSILTEILQRSTTMPVLEATNQLPVEADKVYIIPPNRDMTIANGVLQLYPQVQPRGQRMPIDAFLRSLADDRQERAIGIILSGTGSDGTLGLRAICGAGGFTLVQEPASAKYDGMPTSAIKAGYATRILPAEAMPKVLLALKRTFGSPSKMPASPKVDGGLNNILAQLRTQTGHDFSLYKKSTVYRRIERRMMLNNIESQEIYLRYLKENPAETRALFKELLINVTSFFRDADAFAVLQNDILPQVCQDKPDNYTFRVWVAGCATGEEAYSLAIVLREMMEEMPQAIKLQIYSTDLDDEAIAVARGGMYPHNIAQDVSPERLRRFFIKEDGGYRVKKEIRDMVVFAVQNVAKDPPFTRLDLLSCRNLMIYLEPELQHRLIQVFHYALKPGGILFLSPSESIGAQTALFSSLNRKWKLYQALHSLTSTHALIAESRTWQVENGLKPAEGIVSKPKENNLGELTRRLLVQYFAPAAVLTDLKGDILYIHGETGKYLRPAPGQASLNIIEMAREGLAEHLRSAIHDAPGKGLPILDRELQVKTNGGFSPVSLSVRALPNTGGDHDMLLVNFKDSAAKPRRKRAAKPAEAGRIQELERDLLYSKESYQAAVEEQQVTNEELKSANEEMQSANEELQSSNEELETSKEELQSVNEELITVNSELQTKIEQLINTQNDMKNLLDNISTGIIFLDRNLLIRSFTREATRVYRLAPSDVGRPLADIRSVLGGEDLLAGASSVLETLIPYERELPLGDDAWILARIQPYRTLDNLIDGVVLTFNNITALVKSAALQEALTLAQNVIDTVREPLLVLDASLNVLSASSAFYREFRISPEDAVVGRKIFEINDAQWDIPSLRELLEKILSGRQALDEYEVTADFALIGRRTINLHARRIISKVGNPELILLSMEINL